MSTQPDGWYSEQDYEADLLAVTSTVADLVDGHRRFPKVTQRNFARLVDAAAKLREIAWDGCNK